jgi:hypothetical protein
MRILRILLLTRIGLAAHVAVATSAVTDWNATFLQAVRDVKMGPPQTARAGAIVHTCIYDAWACYDAKANGSLFFGFLRRPEGERTVENKEKAIAYAAYRALLDLFPARKADFDARMNTLGFDIADNSTDLSTPQGIGNFLAQAVLARRHFDGANQLGDLHTPAYSDYTAYTPVNPPIPLTGPTMITDPNRWSPLQFATATPGVFATPGYLVPQWGGVTPFAMTRGSQFRPKKGPARHPSALYKKQAAQIVRFTARLDDRQKCIAEYWADGPASETPPGHWNLHATTVSQQHGYSIDDDAKLFFALNNAELDASIAVWEAKRLYDSERPIAAIRFLSAGKTIPTWGATRQSPATVSGENWKPYQPDTFLTPPFPEFPSGHSCFSSAAATILKSFTGSNAFNASVTILAASSKTQTGIPAADVTLSWPTFTAAAEEAGLSRLLGGIHFQQANLASQVMGKKIGKAVWQKAEAMFNGENVPGIN